MNLPTPWQVMAAHWTTTLCWRCSSEYDINLYACPQCNAINGNADLEGAIKQMDEHDENS